MLQLDNITKDYFVSGGAVHALKGVTVNFRESEFVSILGHSGCGKTTMLNIIGGLDHYTSGDLIINGRSTKSYKDRDWDVYRNHRIGFIFQSYNLIPHQTVLQNVELALTISGVSKEERVARSKEVLNRVGLSKEYNKKPNQLSGGQCQRVAIARALVNNPEILLADEPTGALDSETSVQIMNLIKEISGERLVIMVTHNPELAEQYSSRIVRLKDGLITEDTNPYNPTEQEIKEVAQKDEQELSVKKVEKGKKKEKAKMSFITAFKLSLKNLISKKGRTTMVGIAGSIGIVGIATVLAFSAGIKGYVASMQDDMLSGNPITITEQSYDLDAMTDMMGTSEKIEIIKEPNKVYVDSLVKRIAKTSNQMNKLLVSNDITKEYVDYIKQMPNDYYSAMKFGYGLKLENNIFATFKETSSDSGEKYTLTSITDRYMKILSETEYATNATYLSALVPSFEQAPNSEEYIKSQYDIYGKVATDKNEIMLVLNKEDELSDVLLAKLGYFTEEEFLNLIYSAGEEGSDLKSYYNENLDKIAFTYGELLDDENSEGRFTWHPNNQVFVNGGVTYSYVYKESDLASKTENAIPLKVVGILTPKESISYGCLSSGVYYTQAFADEVVKISKQETGGYLDVVKELATHETLEMMDLMKLSVPYTYTYHFKNDTKTVTDGAVDFTGLGGNPMFAAFMQVDVCQSAIRSLGGNDIANSITIYPVDFDIKDKVTEYLDKWNDDGEVTVNGTVIQKADRSKITYTDTLSLIISIINTMIDVISYALIAFTSISLVVSTVMIGIITYVSVVERIKEIGVIRSLGGRKKDVSHLFNAETFILGLLSGLIGVTVTYGISAIVNAILYPIIHIRRIAALPLSDAGFMILLSIVLTLISGLIPARSAANKDPVIALRTE